jgi:hypothetical protein
MNIEGTYARVNGGRRGRNVFYLDGSDNTGSFRNSGLQFPNPEAVEEVNVSTSNTSAEFGKQPGGTFNVITKSGTNEFHGSGFYFFRNEALNANSWSRNKSGSARPPAFLKQGGGTFGGPVRHNKTFFFTSFMLYRDNSNGFQNTIKFPSKAMLAGDFSQFTRPLYDPDTGAPLPGNIIPQRLLDPVAANLLKLVPTVPNYGDRYVWSFNNPIQNQEVLGKLDESGVAVNFPPVRLALSVLGCPYVWGATGPDTFDCSGLADWIMWRYTSYTARGTTSSMWNTLGTGVSLSQLQPGDMIFWEAGHVHHVGMYIGGGKYVHAPRTGDVVKISELSARSSTIASIRRPAWDAMAMAPTQ